VITVNGEPTETQPGATLTEVLRGFGLTATTRGVAIAVDGEVVPRSAWATFALPPQARVEVLAAMQGG
jgi:sulfur carrier protein